VESRRIFVEDCRGKGRIQCDYLWLMANHPGDV